MPSVVPMLSYEDVGVAADWLCRAFGFRETARFGDGQRVTHVNLATGDGMVMAGWPGPRYQSPRRHREACAAARDWSATPFVIDGVYVQVGDIESHLATARAAGATILSDLEGEDAIGQRQYRAEDLEGHRWMFAEPL